MGLFATNGNPPAVPVYELSAVDFGWHFVVGRRVVPSVGPCLTVCRNVENARKAAAHSKIQLWDKMKQ